MSEVIEEFIRRHNGTREGEAFERFLQEPRIRTWVGDDPARRDRLRREFARVWTDVHPGGGTPAGASGQVAANAARAPPRETLVTKVEVRPEAKEAPPEPARHLHLLCPQCHHVDVWLHGTTISCRRCGAVYDDMLALVPVKHVGPFEYMFGEGHRGWLTAAGVALLLVAVYGVLRWL